MAVRLKDIAADLGLSTVTISKVLRGNTDVGAKTRALVLKRMKEVGYRPNMIARGLASGRSYTVGLIVPDLVHPFFGEFAKYLGDTLRQHSRALIIASAEEDPEHERQEIRTLLSRGVDVLLIASCQSRVTSIYESAAETTPYLLVDRNFAHLKANFVGSDNFEVGRMATAHLIETGKKRIAHISGRSMSPVVGRLRGYKAALATAGIEVRPEYIVKRDRLEESGDAVGYKAMQDLLRLKQRPDAVFCYNDLTAIGAMEATLQAGLRIPYDVSFIGCGNSRYARYLRVPLSSIDHSTIAMGKAAGELALRLADAPGRIAENILLAPTLIERESSIGASAYHASVGGRNSAKRSS